MKALKQYVAGFLFVGDRVLLIRKQKPAWQRGRLNGVGGKLERTDRTFHAAMAREFFEETGVAGVEWEHFTTLCGVDPEDLWYEVVFFRARLDECPKVRNEEGTGEQLQWCPVDQLDEVLPNLRWLVPMAMTRSSAWPYAISERTALALHSIEDPLCGICDQPFSAHDGVYCTTEPGRFTTKRL